jgi:hypothetical protein
MAVREGNGPIKDAALEFQQIVDTYEKELSAFKLKHANEVSLLQTENQELNQKVKS